jgi:hypothetical protein
MILVINQARLPRFNRYMDMGCTPSTMARAASNMMPVLIHFIVSTADIFFILVLYYMNTISVNFHPGVVTQPFYPADVFPIQG